MVRYLGISCFYHDAAAALVEDGRIIAAAQEERFTRRKHDPDFPTNAIRYCLAEAKCRLEDVEHIIFYEDPALKVRRLLSTFLATVPRSQSQFMEAAPLWLNGKLFQRKLLLQGLKDISGAVDESRVRFSQHHLSHAASAFFPSPFEEAAILTMDGVGEWATTSVYVGKGSSLTPLKEIRFPHSLGLLYSAITAYIGFKVNSGEYKVMGLAPYGKTKYADLMEEHLVDIAEDGTFWLDQDYFGYTSGFQMFTDKLVALFGQPARRAEDRLTQFHMDVAASIQEVTERIVLRLTRALARETGLDNLCLAGGVALNCVANGKVLRDGAFKRIWIQPAAGDAGGALGAALAGCFQFDRRPRDVGPGDAMRGSYLGPAFGNEEIAERLTAAGARFSVLDEETLIRACVKSLDDGDALGWFQGRMEFGPRALGGRSILGDPRNSDMQRTLNLRVKYRESFRPFAPSVLREHVGEWFDLNDDSPYMLLVADVLDRHRIPMTEAQERLFGIDKLNIVRSEIPAVTHVDYSARIQTVHADTNPLYHRLLTAFHRETGCPVLVNTSFNVRGEPIVSSPEDAFRCFMGTDIEALAIGNAFLRKEDQDPALRLNYKDRFELD